jgi:hypothetical protein
VQAQPRPYIAFMRNRNLHYPTTEELYAFEREARRLRAEEMARLMRAGSNAVRSLFKTKAKRFQHA